MDDSIKVIKIGLSTNRFVPSSSTPSAFNQKTRPTTTFS